MFGYIASACAGACLTALYFTKWYYRPANSLSALAADYRNPTGDKPPVLVNDTARRAYIEMLKKYYRDIVKSEYGFDVEDL